MEDGVLHRVYILGLFCPKQGQGLKPSAAPLYPTIGQVPPRGSFGAFSFSCKCNVTYLFCLRECLVMSRDVD